MEYICTVIQTPYVLYRVFAADDRLLYVGATTNPKLRFMDHAHKEWWLEAAKITLEHVSDLDELMAVERRAIESENPTHNVIHCKPAHWARKRRSKRGDGTVFQRADGYWVAGMELPAGPNGKRRLKRFVAASREVAVGRLEEFKRSLNADANG